MAFSAKHRFIQRYISALFSLSKSEYHPREPVIISNHLTTLPAMPCCIYQSTAVSCAYWVPAKAKSQHVQVPFGSCMTWQQKLVDTRPTASYWTASCKTSCAPLTTRAESWLMPMACSSHTCWSSSRLQSSWWTAATNQVPLSCLTCVYMHLSPDLHHVCRLMCSFRPTPLLGCSLEVQCIHLAVCVWQSCA